MTNCCAFTAALCSEFLKNFVDESNRTKYLTQLVSSGSPALLGTASEELLLQHSLALVQTEIKLRRRQLLEVSLDDLYGVRGASVSHYLCVQLPLVFGGVSGPSVCSLCQSGKKQAL